MSKQLETLKEMAEIDEKIAVLKWKIGRAKADAAVNRQFSDPEWFWDSQRRLRRLQSQRQRLQMQMKELKSAPKEHHIVNFFIDAAKELLDHETVGKLFQRAKELRIQSDGKES